MPNQQEKLASQERQYKEAFAEIYEQNFKNIFGYCLRRTANVTIAQDITSQTFIKAFGNIGKYEHRGLPISCWLYRIASNEITDYYREVARKPLYFIENLESLNFSNSSQDEIFQAQYELEKYDEYLEVHRSIEKLPAKYQEVIALRFFEQKSLREIAQILGKREGTIKSLLHRSLQKLKIIMN